MLQIKERYAGDKPREKLLRNGVSSLTTAELIAVILGSGQAAYPLMTISVEIEKLIEKGTITMDALKSVKGVGTAKACQILSVQELARRMSENASEGRITSSADAAMLLSSIRNRRQEHFVCLTLDGGHRLIAQRTVFIGTLNQSIVHPREVFADAITDRAAAIIVAHNHPSGTLDASPEDKLVTERLKMAGDLLGIELLDHIIVTAKGFWSFKGHNLL